MFAISPRLRRIAGLIRPGDRIWDVGTDHAKLPVWLIKNGIIGFAAASDIRSGPLESARRNAEVHLVSDRIRFILCDGLSGGGAEMADTIIIAGMGGETIAEILKNALWTAEEGIRLILQPMTASAELRKFLFMGDYTVKAEYIACEREKSYLIIEAVGGGTAEGFTFAELQAGKAGSMSADNSPQDLKRHVSAALSRLGKALYGAGVERDAPKMKLLEEAIKEIKDRYGYLEGHI
ncbi:MAG: class I SAM-dependent methyltransferase [Oscillospiraceae bacterium]|jgi:tRNA (adenine22-N1)-methyltransferase|nr:class I SAM-dependent methyltransferase [Oscillospiraceae bacterium]